MNNFALISEGITDQVTIENILYGHYEDDLDITSIQPARDATDENRQSAAGGWERVLEYLCLEDFKKIFLFNEFVIIHIDTDCGDHPNFGVQLTSNGKDREPQQIINDVTFLLRSKIGADVYAEYQERIIFAIAVDCIECWLLPLHSKIHAHKVKKKNCEAALNFNLQKAGVDYTKDYLGYMLLTRQFKSRSSIKICKTLNESFAFFIDSLPAEINA
ncbi:MAG: hypothetical protein DID89_2727546962 [Candidatus Nitrotoga sp. CP45]|nr:MAG: hypothetical protein DID89_2727546962 [Candidatus Nitrotoga sp. CP45]